MDSYTDFAQVYDELMDETPYEEWAERLVDSIERYGISKPKRDAGDLLESERNLVVDLGCGTGTLTEMLYEKGYDMIGVDLSDAMLAVAMEKRERSGANILYLNQDMRELELYSTVGTVISVCDSINYITDPEELPGVFSLVHNYLYPNGLFLFDFNTDFKYREVIGDTTIAENREDCSFIWENFFDEESGVNEYDLTIFVKEEGESFRRFQETHFQRGYTCAEIQKMLLEAGFEIVSMTDSEAEEQPIPGEETERIFVIARCRK